MNQRAVGTVYEKRAGAYLKQQGYELLEYNFCCRSGEIDLVARDGAYLVFVEVKYRRTAEGGNPLEAVDGRKQRKISRAAAYYCMTHGYGEDMPYRFDVVAVLGEKICVVKNAFEWTIK